MGYNKGLIIWVYLPISILDYVIYFIGGLDNMEYRVLIPCGGGGLWVPTHINIIDPESSPALHHNIMNL